MPQYVVYPSVCLLQVNDDSCEEARSELTPLTLKLRENEAASVMVMSQLQRTDAAVEDDTQHVCKLYINILAFLARSPTFLA